MSQRSYLHHILRTLLCIGAMMGLFCQRSFAINADGREYFFIQFVNIEGDNRFVSRGITGDLVTLRALESTSEQNMWSSNDQWSIWAWDGAKLRGRNRYLTYNAETGRYQFGNNNNNAVEMEIFTDANGNIKLRRKGQTEYEMGYNANGEVVDVPSTNSALYAIGTSTTYEDALSYQNEIVSNVFYIRFTNRTASTVGQYVVATDNGVGQAMTMTVRGNHTQEATSNKLWMWVDGKYLRNLEGHYIYLDGSESKTTANKSEATRFRIYYSYYARPKLRVMNADGTDRDLVMRAQTVRTDGSPVVSSASLNDTDDELELVDFTPVANQPYFIRFVKDTYNNFVHELGYPDSYNGHAPALFHSPGTNVGTTKVDNKIVVTYTAKMKSMTWTLESTGTEDNYHIKSGNDLYISSTFTYAAWGNRKVYTVDPSNALAFIVKTRTGDSELALTDTGNPNGALDKQNNPYYYVTNYTGNSPYRPTDNDILDFIRNDAPLPQDVPAMEDGHWYKLSFGNTTVQTLIRAHVGTDGYYTLEHDNGRYVYWDGTAFAYTTDPTQAAKFEVCAERSGWHLERVTNDINLQVVVAQGNTFMEVYHNRNANNTKQANTYFSFEEVEDEHPVMEEGKWYKLSFKGKEQTLVRAHIDANGYYYFEHDLGRYVHWNGTSFDYTTDVSQAEKLCIRAELSGYYLSRVSDPNDFNVMIANGNTFSSVAITASTDNRFSFEEDTTVDLSERPTMQNGEWYELYFHDTPICAKKVNYVGDDAAGNRIYTFMYGGQYLMWDSANNKYVNTQNASDATQFVVTRELTGWHLSRLVDNFYGGATVGVKGTNGSSSFKEVPVSISTYFGVDLIPSVLEDGAKYVFYFKNNELRGMYDLEMEHGGDCDLMNLYPNYGGMAWTALEPVVSGDDFYYRFKNEFDRYIAWDGTKYIVTSNAANAAHFVITGSDYGYYLLRAGTTNAFLHSNTTTFIEKATNKLTASEKEWASIYFQKVVSDDAWYDEATINNEVIHRPSYFQDRANDLGGAFTQEFLQPGSGMTTKSLTGGGSVDVQDTPEYRQTRYVKRGEFAGLYLSTSNGTSNSRLCGYQRWYMYDTETPLTHKYHMPYNNNNSFLYKNGQVMGSGLINSNGTNLSKKTAADEYKMFVGLSLIGRLPTNEERVTIACDFSFDIYNTYGDGISDLQLANPTATSMGEGGDLTEPTLSLRQIWTLIDAKVIANELTDSTQAGGWLESRTIHFPNRTQGLSKEYLPLENDLEDYWFYTNYTSAADRIDEKLVSLGQVDGTQYDNYYRIELEDPNNTGIYVDPTLATLPGSTDNGMFMSNTSYKRRRHVTFSYPEATRQVAPGSRIVIKVYAKDHGGNGAEYNVAKFTIIFDGGTETLPWKDIVGNDADENYEKRSPEALIARCGNPHAHLDFDYNHSLDFTSPFQTTHDNIMAALPLQYHTTNYAFARRKGDKRIAAGWGSSGVGNMHTAATGDPKNSISCVLRSVSDYTGISYPNDLDRGYLFVDASDMPGQVATVSFDGDFCEGSLLMCSGWMASVSGGFISNNREFSPGCVILTVMGRRYNGDGTYTEKEVYSFCPGQLDYYARRSNGNLIYPQDNQKYGSAGDYIWQQFYFEFYGNGSDEYYLKIDNNATSTDGGDYMLDDIWIFAILPSLETNSMMPLCGGNLEAVRLENKFETLLNSTGLLEYNENDLQEQTRYLNLTYLDWDKFVYEFKQKVEAIDGITYDEDTFLEKLESGDFADGRYHADYVEVFQSSLLRDDVTDQVAYTNVQWSNKFDSEQYHEEYQFAKLLAPNPVEKVYYTTENGVRKLIFNGRMNVSSFKYYHKYMLLAALGNAPIGPNDVGQFNIIFNVLSTCSTHTPLYMQPFIQKPGEVGLQDLTEMSHCLNSIETLNMNMTVYHLNEETQQLEVEEVAKTYFDWWVGDKDTAGTVDNFNLQVGGTAPNTFTLQYALKCFRYSFPTASNIDGIEIPEEGISYTPYEDYVLTPEMLDYLKELVHPSDGSMPRLYLRSRTINVLLDETNFKIVEENGKRYVCLCAMPIELDLYEGISGDHYYTCSEPQEVRVKVDEVAPHIDLGFADLKYPEQLDLLSVRLSKSQFEQVNARNPNHTCLHIPIRNVQAQSANSIGIKNVGGTGDVILLTATTDTEMEEYLLSGYLDMEGAPVGKITYLYGTNGNDEELPEEAVALYFNSDFKVREGYSYTLKFPYTERFSNESQISTRCEGYGAFIVKIVPDYEVWTGGTGNIDWSNDSNWRRADKDELFGDNGTTLTSYLDNGHVENGEIVEPASNNDGTPYVNYITADDRLRMQGFAPLYCTNVLMLNKETADAPVLYDDGPEVDPVTNEETGFPALRETASPMLRYDFQAHEWPNLTNADGTPDYDSNNAPNPLDPSKKVRQEGDIVTELYRTNQCGGIVFQHQTELVRSELLEYNKAWVEYELDKNQWHLVGSPLQDMISGEWYAPTYSARQETTYFEDIQFDVTNNVSVKVGDDSPYALKYDRFAPAVYQRAWDKAKAVVYDRAAVWDASDNDQTDGNYGDSGLGDYTWGAGSAEYGGGVWTPDVNADDYLQRLVYKPMGTSKANVAIKGTWSGAYNNHTVPYTGSGFSVMPINNLKPAHNDESVKTIFRLPKEDQYYDIWDWNKGYVLGRRVRVYIDDRKEGETRQWPPANVSWRDSVNADNTVRLPRRGRLRTDTLKTVTSFVDTLKNEGNGSVGYFLVSNPFICGLDMQKFFAENTHLAPYYLVLKDSPLTGHQSSDLAWQDVKLGDLDILPPRHAFFVRAAEGGNLNQTTVTFTGDMQVPHRVAASGGSNPAPQNFFTITAERGDKRSSARVILHPDASNLFLPQEDMETFVVSDITSDIPVVYTLCGRLATSVNRLHDFNSLPIGIESDSQDAAILTFTGVENLGDEVQFYDAYMQALMPLQEGTKVRVPGSTQNRYFILRGNINEAIAKSNIQITSDGNNVYVVSTTGEPLTQVWAYDASGRLIYSAKPQQPQHNFTLPKGIYVVTAKTDDSQNAQKVLMQ